MYYILYGFLYLLSLLPWRVLYFISDGIYALVYYVIGYRKDVTRKNLLIAFPEKSEKERVRIAKDFYHNFIDTFFEIIKFLSISDKEFSKRVSANFELLEALYKTGQNVQAHSGHFFNIEYFNWGLSKYSPYPFIGIYMSVKNKAAEKIITDMRSRYKAILLSATTFKSAFHQYAKGRYVLGLAADQTPAAPLSGYWVNFFGRLTPFVTGPERSARLHNTAVIFINYYKVKRGYYNAELQLVTTTPKEFSRGDLTKRYAAFLEASIRKRPSNYLWSHRRWKWEFKEEYRKLVV